MALHLEILKNLYGYSWAKYATWLYYKSDNLLFDAGEGVSIAMRNKIYAVDNIFISHGHGDHIFGLAGFLSSRASSMGDQHKPLNIHYPKGDRNISRLRQYLEDALGSLPFPVLWKELSGRDRIELARNRSMESFVARHNSACLSLGYRIVEHRTRLKEQYRDLPSQQLAALRKKEGKDGLCEEYDRTLLCYSGDSMPLDPGIVRDAEVLLHDCTFLKAEDRDENTHATLEEVLKLAVKGNVSSLALFHFSTRYHRQEITRAIQQGMSNFKVDFPVSYLLPQSPHYWFKQVEENKKYDQTGQRQEGQQTLVLPE